MHSNVTSKNVSGFTLAGPPCIVKLVCIVIIFGVEFKQSSFFCSYINCWNMVSNSHPMDTRLWHNILDTVVEVVSGCYKTGRHISFSHIHRTCT